MPMFGLGTWELTDEQTCPEAVATALEMGYRRSATASHAAT